MSNNAFLSTQIIVGNPQVLIVTPAGATPTPPAGPTNTVAPVVTEVAGIFYTTDGTWTGTGTITYTYQWQADGVDITGATSSSFISTATQSGTDLRCVITATDDNGSTGANSNAVAAVVGPIAYYTLDAADGSDETDNYDLTTYGTGAITTTAGVINNANVFNGSNFQSNFVGSFTDLNSASDITIAGWFNSQDISAADFAITITQNGGDYAQYVIRAFESKYQAEVLFDGTYFSVADSGVGGDGVWHHITAVFSNDANGSSGSMSIYADGVFKSSASYPSQWVTPNIEYIGVGTGISASGASYSPWDGYMDDVRIYNRALSSAEVTALYDWSIEQQDITTDLTHYWRPSTTSDATDSASSLDGTLTGGLTVDSDGFKFDAIGERVTFGSSRPDYGSSYTYTFWAKPDLTAIGSAAWVINDQDNTVTGRNLQILIDSDNLGAAIWLADSTVDGAYPFAMSDDTWVFFALTADATSMKLSVNAATQAVVVTGGAISNKSQNEYRFGGNSTESPTTLNQFFGAMDDIRCYCGRVLSTLELTAIHDLGRGA